MCIRDRLKADRRAFGQRAVVNLEGGARVRQGLQWDEARAGFDIVIHRVTAVSYTHLRAHETVLDLVCRLLLEKKNRTHYDQTVSQYNPVKQDIDTTP